MYIKALLGWLARLRLEKWSYSIKQGIFIWVPHKELPSLRVQGGKGSASTSKGSSKAGALDSALDADLRLGNPLLSTYYPKQGARKLATGGVPEHGKELSSSLFRHSSSNRVLSKGSSGDGSKVRVILLRTWMVRSIMDLVIWGLTILRYFDFQGSSESKGGKVGESPWRGAPPYQVFAFALLIPVAS